MAKKHGSDANFRDIVSTVDQKGKRKWMYVLQPEGRLYRARTLLSIVYLLLFFSLPWIKIDGNPLFQFDIIGARFILFGNIFLPQDFILFGIAMLIGLVFIIIFTLVYGRVFCGWVCPQTIFMEMVFRRIEYWIEGPANRQQRENEGSWTTEMYIRKAFKHVLFFAISFLIANTFLAYIIGTDALINIITDPLSQHIVGFLALLLFTFIFYVVFAFVREIVCIVICPYGRLQSVLLDRNSIVVAYDYIRGEPRAKAAKVKAEGTGDCIDCELCVRVCPTGIDIRNGTQLECINCTACIDACNMMMEKVNRPLNLIRYDSENNIAEGKKVGLTNRTKAYSVVLLALLALLLGLLLNRSTFDVAILRVPGQTLQENADGTISNLYRIKIINKSHVTMPYQLHLLDSDAKVEYIGMSIDSLHAGEAREETFFIKKPKDKINTRKTYIPAQIKSGDKIIAKQDIMFVGEY